MCAGSSCCSSKRQDREASIYHRGQEKWRAGKLGFHCLCRASDSSGTWHLSPGSALETSACSLASPCPCCGHTPLFSLLWQPLAFTRAPSLHCPLPGAMSLHTHTGLSCTAPSKSFLPLVLSGAVQGLRVGIFLPCCPEVLLLHVC